jgi:hypothetical protein
MADKPKKANKKPVKKRVAKQKKRKQPKKRDYMREKARTLSTNNENDYELEKKLICLLNRNLMPRTRVKIIIIMILRNKFRERAFIC